MRKPKPEIKPAFVATEPAGIWKETFECELLTPMVGGGVKSWEVDHEMPVRASEIKSQLRFWWRAGQPVNTTQEDLLRDEEGLFGSTSKASPLSLHVDFDQPSANDWISIIPDGHDTRWMGCPGYVLFPLLGIKGVKKFNLLKSLKFRLHVRAPEESKPAIMCALTRWVILGGIGARTRRGCGSIRCEALVRDMSINNIPQAVGMQNDDADIAYWPSLHGARMSGRIAGDPQQAWSSLLTAFGAFRQQRFRPMGKSLWPEADSIRLSSGNRSTYPSFLRAKSHPQVVQNGFYPRAAYGLPLPIQFLGPRGGGNPLKFEILPHVDPPATRWPSPVILKVVQLANGAFAQVCVVLNHVLPQIALYHNNVNVHAITPAEMPDCGKTILEGHLPVNGVYSHSLLFDHMRHNLGLEMIP